MNQLSSLQNSETTRFRQDIQLLRAIAILFVVLNHIDFAFLSVPAGYRGVDVFFVVSGFVIMSSILRQESEGQRFSLLKFFKRRAQRLYPAFLVVIICVFVVSFLTQSFIHVQQETARTGFGSSLFFANYISCYIKKEKPLIEFSEQFRTHMFNIHKHYLTELKEQKLYVKISVVIKFVNNIHPSLLMSSLHT